MTPVDLQKWRHANGYSQSQLAKALGVLTMTISRWETGRREISPYLHLALKSLRKRKGTIKAGRPAIKKSSKKKEKGAKQ